MKLRMSGTLSQVRRMVSASVSKKIMKDIWAGAGRMMALLAMTAALGVISTMDAHAADYTISSAWFDDYNGSIIARWDQSPAKTRYRVQLYKGAVYDSNGNVINANKVGNLIKTSGESHDMTRLIKNEGAGTYCFTVYPVEDSSRIVVSEELQVTYERLDGMSDLAGWQKSNGYWYYYDGDGTMRYGWQYIDGVWYYLSSKGDCLLDTYTPDGYYVDATGAWDGNPKVSSAAGPADGQ